MPQENEAETKNSQKKPQQDTETAPNAETKLSKIDRYLLKFSRVPAKEKIFFVQNLGVMIHAGLSMSRALKTLSLQTENKYFKHTISEVNKEVEKGTTLSEAMKQHPRVFDELFINMIASGEVSGNLENVLSSLFLQMKKDHDLVSKIRGAMIYPSVIIVAMIGIGIFMMIFIMPKIISIFEDIDVELPLPTRIMIIITNIFKNYSLAAGGIAIILITIIVRLSHTNKGRHIVHWIWLHAPIVKNISWKINIARMCRTLSSLLKTEISIVKALEITSKTVGNVHYKNALRQIAENIKTGAQLNQSMSRYPKLFPPLVTQMTLVGEESGTLDSTLEEIAQFFENEVDQTMTNLPALIEPLLILILGVGVGFIAVSVLLPMYSLSNSI